METLALVKPTAQEQILSKIENMKRSNLTAVWLEKLSFLKTRFRRYFLDLTLAYFSLSEKQVLQLSDREIDVLFTLVSERARRRLTYLKVLWVMIPFYSWVTYDLLTVRFIRSLSKVKKILGDKFNAVSLIRTKAY